jgi:hypothetical protein
MVGQYDLGNDSGRREAMHSKAAYAQLTDIVRGIRLPEWRARTTGETLATFVDGERSSRCREIQIWKSLILYGYSPAQSPDGNL